MIRPIDTRVLRLLDANANRSREALRVLEDYARFILDDQSLSAELKHLRHDLAALLRPLLPNAILHRDTPGDVGRANKTKTEFTRDSVADVITAAAKRLTESLRALEEFAKLTDPQAAVAIEKLRYSAYTLEARLSLSLRPPGRFAKVRLYVLITASQCHLPWLQSARAAIAGGADAIQLREKSLESAELLSRARVLAAECRRANVIFIVNDRPDIAILSKAAGIHVGQHDLPAREVRKLIGPDLILGVSTHNLAQARQAVADSADYIGLGPVFPSSTKPRDFVAGLATLKQVTSAIKIPVVAIAGITPENVADVAKAGPSAIAVTAAVLSAKNPKSAARQLKTRLKSRK